MNLVRRYRLLAGLAIALVLLNTWWASRELRTLFSAQEWQSHTQDVLSRTEELAVGVRAADAAARGFMLTGNSIFETRYKAAEALIHERMVSLQQLTADNPTQQQRINYTRARISAKLGALDAGINMRKGHADNSMDPAVLDPALSDSPDGQASVPFCLTQIENEEQRLLRERTSETRTARLWALFAFYGASALDIILVLASFRLLLHAHIARVRLAEDAMRIAQLNAETLALNAELEDRVQARTRELEVSNKELEAFAYSVSHDLRAPLRTIDGFSLALQEDYAGKLDDEGRDYINRVRNGVQRMGSLIDALLQLSRVTRTDVVREKVDLSQLATLVFNEQMAGVTDRDVRFSAAPGLIAEADPRLLRVAFENLLGNALKYTSRTPHAVIEFGQASDANRTVYFLKDNGVGFDMTYVDRLFTAFQRLHGDRDFKGSGIGLATVSRIRHWMPPIGAGGASGPTARPARV